MPLSDSEDETLEELDFDGEDDPEVEGDDEPVDLGPEDATDDGDDVRALAESTYSVNDIIQESASEDSEDSSESEDDEGNDDSEMLKGTILEPTDMSPSREATPPTEPAIQSEVLHLKHKRSLSPAYRRKKALRATIGSDAPSSSYTVEAVCAIPHPVPTHALASSLCMTHLLTGSDDGYIRDYDIFAAVNGKLFLTAPQRHHSGVVEGILKSGQLRCWWENPAFRDTLKPTGIPSMVEELPLPSPVYSLTMHSDALWALAGSDSGHINLFTTRHEPGRLIHGMSGHRGPVSSLCMDHEEKGFYSAGWDGEAIQWDLNNGQRVRTLTAHGAQLATIAIRPLTSGYSESVSPVVTRRDVETTQSLEPVTAQTDTSEGGVALSSDPAALSEDVSVVEPPESDAKSEASYDPLFDGELEAPENLQPGMSNDPAPSTAQQMQPSVPKLTLGQIPPPKNAPPLLDAASYSNYSPDLIMTASIDGQVILWDKRVQSLGTGVGRLWMSEKTPPWCLSACWSADGGQIYAGRRNGAVDVWDVRQLGRSGPSNTPRLLKTLRNPLSSGVVSCVVAFPDCRHIACASIDNLRLWNVAEAGEPDSFGKAKSGVQFKIIPGHHGGYVSQMLVDPGARFLVSASSNRGWHGDSTRTVFVHDIKRS